ncbi:unnamed protein product [Ectocarpus sp. 12 AP-2014]
MTISQTTPAGDSNFDLLKQVYEANHYVNGPAGIPHVYCDGILTYTYNSNGRRQVSICGFRFGCNRCCCCCCCCLHIQQVVYEYNHPVVRVTVSCLDNSYR